MEYNNHRSLRQYAGKLRGSERKEKQNNASE